MDAAFELGINVFDTADAYGGGRSESAIGKWLAGKGSAVRDQVLISSKAFNPVGEGPNDYGLSRRHLKRQVERSLARLGVEHLDLFLTHEPDADTRSRRRSARSTTSCARAPSTTSAPATSPPGSSCGRSG